MCSKGIYLQKIRIENFRDKFERKRFRKIDFILLKMMEKMLKNGTLLMRVQFGISGKGRRDFREKFIFKFKLALIRYLNTHKEKV